MSVLKIGSSGPDVAAMQAALARHDELLTQAVESHGGHVVKPRLLDAGGVVNEVGGPCARVPRDLD